MAWSRILNLKTINLVDCISNISAKTMPIALTEAMSPTTAQTDLPSVKDHVHSADIFTETYPRSEETLLSEQKQDIDYIQQTFEDQLHLVSEIKEGNAKLKAQYDEAISAQAQLSAQLSALTTEHDKTVQELNEAKRRNTLLKKDKREREQVHAHNLRLKAILQRYLQRVTPSTRKATKTIVDLQNALKVAVARIEALENRGRDLVHALEKQQACLEINDKDDAKANAKSKSKANARVSKAKVAFRETLAKKWSVKLKPSLDDLLQA